MPQNPPGTPILLRLTGCAALAALALVVGAAQAGQQPPPASAPAVAPLASVQPPAQAAEDSRVRELADDSARLLNLAIALKAEVDKTSKDMLSLNVIRKADEIEKLAHSVRHKIKVDGG